MTEPATNPGGETSQDASNIEQPDLIGQEGGVEGASVSTDPKSPNYDFREHMRSDPDKAWEVMRQTQADRDRYAGELRSTKEKLGSLDPFVEQIGGDQLARFIQNYAQMRNHPSFSEYVAALERGEQLPQQVRFSSQDNGESEYEEPWQIKQRELETEIRSLKGEIGNLTNVTSMTKLEDHAKRFFESWPELTEEDKAKIDRGMKQKFQELGQTPNGQQVLRSMTYDHVRTLAMSNLDDERIRELGRVAAQRLSEAKQQRATDSPSVRTTGNEPAAAGNNAYDAWMRAGERVRRLGGNF